MQAEKTPFRDLVILQPAFFTDDRGAFSETFRSDLFQSLTGLEVNFVQDNESTSLKDVLRGLHYQVPPFAQDKLVRVVTGSVLDVVVDLRRTESTYGRYFRIILSAENRKQLFIPKGFAHGFLVLEEGTTFSYKCSAYYNWTSERSLRWNDPNLKIEWDILDPKLSDKDAAAPLFSDLESPF